MAPHKSTNWKVRRHHSLLVGWCSLLHGSLSQLCRTGSGAIFPGYFWSWDPPKFDDYELYVVSKVRTTSEDCFMVQHFCRGKTNWTFPSEILWLTSVNRYSAVYWVMQSGIYMVLSQTGDVSFVKGKIQRGNWHEIRPFYHIRLRHHGRRHCRRCASSGFAIESLVLQSWREGICSYSTGREPDRSRIASEMENQPGLRSLARSKVLVCCFICHRTVDYQCWDNKCLFPPEFPSL